MGTFWKVMVALLLTLPVGAYVVGTLATSQADMPAERDPIVISDAPSDESTKSRKSSPGQNAKPKEGKSPQLAAPPSARGDDGGDSAGGGADDGADDGDDSGDDDIGSGGDNGEVQVVKPRPEKLGSGNDDDDDDDDDEEDDDD